MSAREDDYLTVIEAASLMRVAPSTVRRWIREGDVPAYRLGKRRIALRRTDLSALITPLHPDHDDRDSSAEPSVEPAELTPEEERRQAKGMAMLDEIRRENTAQRETFEFRKLTPEEKERAFETLAELRNLREEMTAKRGGKLLPPSWITINEMRDERTRQLMGG